MRGHAHYLPPKVSKPIPQLSTPGVWPLQAELTPPSLWGDKGRGIKEAGGQGRQGGRGAGEARRQGGQGGRGAGEARRQGGQGGRGYDYEETNEHNPSEMISILSRPPVSLATAVGLVQLWRVPGSHMKAAPWPLQHSQC